MTVIDKLATSLNRRDEIPKQELAKQIANCNDKKAVKELIERLDSCERLLTQTSESYASRELLENLLVFLLFPLEVTEEGTENI